MEPEPQAFARRMLASLERLEQGLPDIPRNGFPAVCDGDFDLVLSDHVPHRNGCAMRCVPRRVGQLVRNRLRHPWRVAA